MGKVLYSGLCGECMWEITDKGRLRIHPIDGDRGLLNNCENTPTGSFPWYLWRMIIKNVVIEKGVKGNKDMSLMFWNMQNCKKIDMSKLDLSETENISWMFAGCSSLKSIKFGDINTKNIKDMRAMFFGCASLRTINLNKLDTSNVRDMKCMFAMSGIRTLDLSYLDMGQVEDMRRMFDGCEDLEELILGNINVDKAKQDDMFANCNKLKSHNIADYIKK